MAGNAPDWLARALGNGVDGSRLTIARIADEKAFGRGGFSLSSPAFRAGEELDPCFTADEEDAVAPPLEWTAPPPGAQEIVVIVEDASADGDEAPVHWLVWGLPGQKGMILEGEAPPRVGKNAHRNSEWLLPEPPHDDPAHTYVFQIFALDLPMTLMPGAERAEVVAAMEGHVMAAAVLTATYKRADEEDGWDEDEEFE